jgi:hypothetical protein
MAQLTTVQKDFLAHHSIPLSRVFDASGLARKKYAEIMREEEKYFVYGDTECQSGHTLRSRPSSRRIGNCNTALYLSVRVYGWIAGWSSDQNRFINRRS